MNEMNRNTISVTEYRALFIRLQLLSGLVHCSAMNYDYNIIKRNLEKSSASHTHTRIKNGVGRNRSVNWSFLALKQTESNESFKKNHPAHERIAAILLKSLCSCRSVVLLLWILRREIRRRRILNQQQQTNT